MKDEVYGKSAIHHSITQYHPSIYLSAYYKMRPSPIPHLTPSSSTTYIAPSTTN